MEGGINLYAYIENNPVNWIDPFGLLIVTLKYSDSPFGSVAMVWNSWLPSFYQIGTIGYNGKEILGGLYEYKYGQHPMNPDPGVTPYPALNLYTLGGSRDLPGTQNGKFVTVSGVNVHWGNNIKNKKSGSKGCHVIPYSENNAIWKNFISYFSKDEGGLYVYLRFW